MPEKKDKRVQRTHQLLRNALVIIMQGKPYEEVTVQDILKQASVSRSTFYAHFHNKDELLFSGFERLMVDLQHNFLSKDVNQNNLLEMGSKMSLFLFKHASENLPIYRTMLGQKSGELIFHYAHLYLNSTIRGYLEMAILQVPQPNVPIDLITHFTVNSLLLMLSWWIDHGLPCSAEEMNQISLNLIMNGLKEALYLV